MSSIHDIEDLADLGRQRKACPYYASRAAVPLAQILVIPYNLLLHKSTREACGIDLKDQVSRYSLTLFLPPIDILRLFNYIPFRRKLFYFLYPPLIFLTFETNN